MSAGKSSGFGLNVPGTSRRSFLRWCAAASGALTPVVARGLRGGPGGAGPDRPQARRHAPCRLLHRGRHHGPAPLGQQDRPAGLSQPLRAAPGPRRQAGPPARTGRVLDPARPEDPRLQAPARGEVPRRHRLQRRGRQVQLQPHEDGPEIGPEGRDGEHRLGGCGRLPHHPAEPAPARRRAAGRAHGPRRHDGLPEGRPGAGPGPRAERAGRRHGAVRVRGVGEGRSHHAEAQRRLLEQASGPVPRPDPLPPHPGRHRQAGEPPVRRDRGDGLRPAA